MSEMTFYEFVIILVLVGVFMVPIGISMLLRDTLGIDVDDIKEYLKERERQKTIRKVAEVQRDREALGVAEERDLFEGHDIDDLVHGKEEQSSTSDATSDTVEKERSVESR